MSVHKHVTYSKEFKEEAVRLYLEGRSSYRDLCEQLGIKGKKSLRSWVAKVARGESLDEGRGRATGSLRGRPRTQFASTEEELAYVKAELEYVKKLYRSRFGHEWGAHKKEFFLKKSMKCVSDTPCWTCSTFPAYPNQDTTNGKIPFQLAVKIVILLSISKLFIWYGLFTDTAAWRRHYGVKVSL